MPDREKIMKAIEYCSSDKGCLECEFLGSGTSGECINKLLRVTLVLLKEQDEQIKEKDETINNLIEQIKDLGN